MQRCAGDLFNENMCPINLADVRTRNGASQVFSAAPAEDWRDSRPKGSWSSSPHVGQPYLSGLL